LVDASTRFNLESRFQILDSKILDFGFTNAIIIGSDELKSMFQMLSVLCSNSIGFQTLSCGNIKHWAQMWIILINLWFMIRVANFKYDQLLYIYILYIYHYLYIYYIRYNNRTNNPKMIDLSGYGWLLRHHSWSVPQMSETQTPAFVTCHVSLFAIASMSAVSLLFVQLAAVPLTGSWHPNPQTISAS